MPELSDGFQYNGKKGRIGTAVFSLILYYEKYKIPPKFISNIREREYSIPAICYSLFFVSS